MIQVWRYDKNKQAGKSHYALITEEEVTDLIKQGLANTSEENISKYMTPWSTIYKDKKDAKENCPYSKKRGHVVLYKNLKTGKFTRA